MDAIHKKTSGALVILFVYVASALFFLAISGAAAVNDEAAYAKTVKIAIEQHRLQLSHLTEPIALVPIGWGTLFLSVTGFSFTALRFSVLVFSLLGALGFYWLLKELGLDEASAMLGPLVLFAYPDFFEGSFQFMTDVPYVCLVIFALLFYVRGLARQRNELLLLGSVFSFAACMTRQPGILIPVCVAVFLLLTRQRLRPVQLFVAVILPLIADLAGLCWFYMRPERMQHRLVNVPGIQLYLETLFYVTAYAGLLSLPLTLGIAVELTRNRRMRTRFGKFALSWCAVLGVVLAWISWKAGGFAPFPSQLAPAGESHNYNTSVMAGYAYVLKEELPFDLPPIALKGLFVASVASAAFLLSLFSMAIASSPAFASTLLRLLGLRKRRVFLTASAIAAMSWLAVFFNRDHIFVIAQRLYNLRSHIHSFSEYLSRVNGAYDSLLAELGVAAFGLFLLQFLPRQRDQGVTAAKMPHRQAAADSFARVGLVYAVCLGQALFVIFVNSITQPFVFRRYILMFAPGVLLFVLTRRKDIQFPKFVAIGSIVLLVLYGGFATRGIMRYNEAKWQGASFVLQRGISPSEINAGLTFNNWYLNAPLIASYHSNFLVVSSLIPGYQQLKKIPVSGSLSGELNVYVLERGK